MTAPASIHPRSVDDLYPGALALTDQLGEVPSRNRLQKQFKIGAPKATELRERLLARTADPVVTPDPATTAELVVPDYPEPIGPVPAPTSYPEPTSDPVPEPVDPERVEVSEPRRGWFRRRRAEGESPQLRVDGHPGPKISPGRAPDPTSAPEPEPESGGVGLVKQFKRIRWAVRLVLALGVAASIAGNVLHARDELISQVISAWSPLALLLTIELISRVPVHSRRLAIGRWAATALIAGIAAWVSYWHMAAVAARYGETNGAQYLLPLSVDGLVVVASICLVELGGRIAANNRR
ncbi:DUF2637 domain-containing protein [Micromonospora schwarzwaldensis]|uniref:DUF2637 domain-containing protein n=1 Tax=Micromonospora sp. DSM 45708 TaxID=3111767 RepID=UPI0031DBBFB5